MPVEHANYAVAAGTEGNHLSHPVAIAEQLFADIVAQQGHGLSLFDFPEHKVATGGQSHALARQILRIAGEHADHRIGNRAAAAHLRPGGAERPDGGGEMPGQDGTRFADGNRRSVFFGLNRKQAGAQFAETADHPVGQDGDGRLDADQRGDTDGDNGNGQPRTTSVGKDSIKGETEKISHHISSNKDLTFKNRKNPRFQLNLRDKMHLIYTYVFNGKEKTIRPSQNR